MLSMFARCQHCVSWRVQTLSHDRRPVDVPLSSIPNRMLPFLSTCRHGRHWNLVSRKLRRRRRCRQSPRSISPLTKAVVHYFNVICSWVLHCVQSFDCLLYCVLWLPLLVSARTCSSNATVVYRCMLYVKLTSPSCVMPPNGQCVDVSVHFHLNT